MVEDRTSSLSASAVLAAGCFWCSEAIFSRLEGVESVRPGYIGGHINAPTYERVKQGDTGHAEAIRITFDPRLITYAELLDIFFHVHDPTTLDRQGEDVGNQYRSAIFPMTSQEAELAVAAIEKAQRIWSDPIVTSIEDGTQAWFEAETYHHDYFAANGEKNVYCSMVVAPKLAKFQERYADRLKPLPTRVTD